MARQFFRGRPFRNTNENRAFDRLCHAVELYTQNTDDVRVIGNVEYDSGQIDALVLKSHAITIVDFKDWGGVITIGPNLPWVNQDGLKVKGGSYANPFMQICAYRAELASDLETAKWPGQDYSHISGFVLFLQNTEFQMYPHDPFSRETGHWFSAGDWDGGVQHICHLSSPKLDLSVTQLDELVSLLGVKSYIPQPEGRLVPASDL